MIYLVFKLYGLKWFVTPYNSPLDLRIIRTYKLATLLFDPQQDIHRHRTTETLKKRGNQHPLLDSKGLSATANIKRNLDHTKWLKMLFLRHFNGEFYSRFLWLDLCLLVISTINPPTDIILCTRVGTLIMATIYLQLIHKGLSPCDFDLIPKMKEPLRGIRFKLFQSFFRR